MENDWQIKIVDPGYKLTYDVYIFRHLPDGRTELINGDSVGQGLLAKPNLELSAGQLRAFATALNEMGIKPDKGFTEGKLVATEKHLEDMRKLLKIK